MTVHFKGTSEYRSRYKGRATRSRSDSPHQRMRLTGLRSDQNKITREPQFPSKRRVPFYPPQVSSSLQWERHDPHQQRHERSRPVTPPAVKPVARATSVESERTPLAPRHSAPQEGTAAPSQQQAEAQAVQPTRTTADQTKLRLAQNGVNHALRKRAGLKSEQQRSGHLSSEYQRQFMRKTPVADSPLLAAHEMFYNDNKVIPPFKSNPVIMESEYRRNFKGSPPPRPPRLRRDVEQCEVPEIFTQEKKKRKKKERQRSRKSSPMEVSHPQLQFQQQEVRKAKTEYSSNFRSPLQYCYRDGAWVKARTAQVEVQELRERAEAYRKRARGTHFSRQHFNQIMSEHNWMWEPSSGTSSSPSVTSECCRSANSSPIIEALDLASPGPSASVATSRRSSTGEMPHAEGPTLPVQRKLAWDEEAGPGERTEVEVLQKERNSEDGHVEPHVNGKIMDKNKRLQVLKTASSAVEGSGGSINGGRLPTPKLKTTQTVQRTHHDRTTPATGGALLVLPPKIKNSFKTWKIESPLGNPHSPYTHIDGSPQRPNSKAVNGSSPNSSPAAGLTTIDPLPIRDDAWSDEEPQYSNPRQAKPSQAQDRQRPKAIVTSPANKIQGAMRNPEFQHNGNLGIFRPELFVFPESDSAVSDNGSVRTGSRSASLLMWGPYQEQLLHFLSLVSLIMIRCLRSLLDQQLHAPWRLRSWTVLREERRNFGEKDNVSKLRIFTKTAINLSGCKAIFSQPFCLYTKLYCAVDRI
ncbi:nuclear protein MDM1 isoform X3 [Triplophysa rosa]|uniref:nuclear protein MDM1 isoform X3 n=1 Tax=Triplophysa rosa TaxID=992332 RepID=UPI0025462C58|nr:nuclear protein MDM1 isoform X3 [Triplophysa rosa]